MATKVSIEEKLTNNVKEVNTKVKNWHQQLVKITDETLDNVLATGEQWQNIVNESIQKGTKLFGKQQDLIFDSLEDVKKMHFSNVKRFKQLIELEELGNKAKSLVKKAKTEKNKVAEKVEKAAVEAKAEVGGKVEKVASKAKAAVAEVSKTSVKPKAAPAKNEDLKLINGIGPKMEGIFKAAGIKTLSDLANAPIDAITTILTNTGGRYKSLDPKEWIEEAKKLIK